MEYLSNKTLIPKPSLIKTHSSQRLQESIVKIVKAVELQPVPQTVLPPMIEPPQQAIKPTPNEKHILHDPDHWLH